jgi:hypothetical protein
MRAQGGDPGISRTGNETEEMYFSATGATKVAEARLGDALLEGNYIEIKKASSNTLNQIRAVKYITVVARDVRDESWYVIPAYEITRQVQAKPRCQHCECAFETSTLSLGNLTDFKIAGPALLREKTLEAIAVSAQYPELEQLMKETLTACRATADRYRAEVGVALEGL